MNMYRILILLIFAFSLYATDIPKRMSKYQIACSVDTNFQVDTLLTINYGTGNNDLTEWETYLIRAPDIFDIDSLRYIYLVDAYYYFYKYSIATNSLIWKHEIKNIRDFKYYKGHLYVYVNDSVRIYNPENFTLVRAISLWQYDVNPINMVNLYRFCDKFLFLYKAFEDYNKSLQYVLNIETGEFSPKIIEDVNISNIYNCQDCHPQLIQDILNPAEPLCFLGQTTNYLFFYFYCEPKLFPEDCPAGYQKSIYFILDKSNDKMILIDSNLILDELILTIRPAVFVNDTSFVFQQNVYEGGIVTKIQYIQFSFKRF